MTGKVLIVDDVSTNRIVFKVKLAAAGYQTALAADGAGCLAQVRAEAPDLILLDCGLPDLPMADILHRLRAEPASRRIPVVAFSADASAARRLEALRAGADDFLLKPIDDQTLLARLRNLLRAQDLAPPPELSGLAEEPALYDGPGLVAVVTHRPERALRLKTEMRAVSRDRFVHLSPDQVFDDGARPDIYLIEADLNGPGSGLQLMSELLSRPTSRHGACLILYDHIPPFAAAMAYDLGAHDLADAQVSPAELALRLARLMRRKREADEARASVESGLRHALRDPLTGLYNRRYAMARLQAIAGRSADQASPFAVMLLDLDRFKSVNDRFGHAAGDAVLTEIARRMAETLRAEDLLARVGGEEFLVALPATGIEAAAAVADRLCLTIRETPIALPGGQRISVTASIGLAIGQPGSPLATAPEVQLVIDQADGALLRAKATGRDQVTVGRSAA